MLYTATQNISLPYLEQKVKSLLFEKQLYIINLPERQLSLTSSFSKETKWKSGTIFVKLKTKMEFKFYLNWSVLNIIDVVIQ